MTSTPVTALVWGENHHEQTSEQVRAVYPDGMHSCIAAALSADDGITATTATLQEPEHGLTDEALAAADVLLWWGHAKHGDVDDKVVERVAEHVWAGLGLIVLHSAHFSKIFKRLMGTPCNLHWREAGERERLWTVNPRHPIAAGIPPHFELANEEMYGEPFGIPEPLETVFVAWFQGGEVFRSGVTFRRGAGNIFYFQPGHEVYPIYHDATIQQILRNAVRWACNPQPRIEKVTDAPNFPIERALEKLEERGPKLHAKGEAGFK